MFLLRRRVKRKINKQLFFINRMGWKDLSYWLRGGIIGSCIYLVLLLLSYVIVISTGNAWVGIGISKIISSITLPIDYIITLFPFYLPFYITSLVGYFLYGAIFGWIYGKIRSRVRIK
jgi:hypothetical protein